jgi:predicted O-linked N-acetylglucosamine transferase (SPINDLY family)
MHSNWKIPIKGWIENIDKKRFSIYGYYTGNKKDKATEDARNSFIRFIEDINSFEEMCRIIRKDKLHILIYPEIGMDPMTVKLAALRLAPIQCVSWGHPETSGFPTIDYFLSSDLMESPDADNHYTEKLIRLPNLSIYYEPPDFLKLAASREEFSLHPKSVVYHCCQSVFKYLPQFDMVFPSIAQEVENCQFLFSSHRRSSLITEQFQSRIKNAFRLFDLNPDRYAVFLPYLDVKRYNSLYYLADVFLDPIGWSGCNSALEAIACNLPVVTYPGEFMRSREGLAILSMLKMQETIASSVDEYIKLAIKLGKDSAWRKQISKKIATQKHLIYHDKKCITALEDFLEKVVKERIVSL